MKICAFHTTRNDLKIDVNYIGLQELFDKAVV